MSDDVLYDSTIRDCLPGIEGRRIIGMTQHDREDYKTTGRQRVDLLLDDGSVLTFIHPERIVHTGMEGGEVHLGDDIDEDEESV